MRHNYAAKCSIKGCTSTRNTNKVYFFPTNDMVRRKWVEIISQIQPEFANKEDYELVQLGVCDKHFMSDQFENGKRKRNSIPNKLINQEEEAGAHDSDPNGETTNFKRKIQSDATLQKQDNDSDFEMKRPRTEQSSGPFSQKTELKVDVEINDICRLCLATGVKMFSLNSEPLKQYFTFIEPCIDELDMLPSENFPTAVCYLCTNSLKTCYEFGKLCAQSQSVLTEYYLIYSKISTKAIKEYDKSNLKLHRNFNKYSLPNISVEPSKQIQNPASIDPSTDQIAKNSRTLKNQFADPTFLKHTYKAPVFKEKAKQVVYNVNDFKFAELESTNCTREVEDDQIVFEYWDEDNLVQNESKVRTSALKDFYERVDLTMPETESLNIIPRNNQSNKTLTSLTKRDPYQTQIGSTQNQGVVFSNVLAKQNILLYRESENIGSLMSPSVSKTVEPEKSPQAASSSDDVLFVDVTNATQESKTNTPTLCESTINLLKKSVLKSHGEVKVKRMYYQGGDIHVIMVNAEGKEVLLKLSRKDNLEPAVDPVKLDPPKRIPRKLVPPKLDPPKLDPCKLDPHKRAPMVVTFDKNCWNMRVLSKDEQCTLINDRKSSIPYLRALYKCTKCFKWFTSSPHCLQHLKKHDPKSGPSYCDVCKMYFSDEKKMQDHQRTHMWLYTCKLCPTRVSYHSILNAKEHQKTHTVYQCSICNEEFSSFNDFVNHANEHTKDIPDENPVDDATALIECEQHIEDPVTLEERSNWTATCCDITLTSRLSLQEHLLVQHPKQTGTERIICDTCGKLVSKNHLANHKKSHKEKNFYQCDHCPKIARTKGQLVMHMVQHTGEKRYLCFKCAKSFTKSTTLRYHLIRCRGNVEVVKPEQERKFTCDVCGRKFFKNYTMQEHKLTVHSGVKKHKQSGRRNQSKNVIELED